MLELNTNLLAELGGWQALKEARGLVERGRVTEARREGAVIRARVQGAEKIHEPRITLAERVANVEVHCTCIEAKRHGRVCAHALAAGLALLLPASASRPEVKAAVKSLPAASPREQGPRRWLMEEAPAGTPVLEITVLLPLQLPDALGRDPVRVILEARRGGEGPLQPFDVVRRDMASGFAVTEEDERILSALEKMMGVSTGINLISLGRIGIFFRALSGHPRIWLGKKQRIEVKAARSDPR